MNADAVDAFDALGNETRLAIRLALWESYDPHAGDNAVQFPDRRECVCVRDPGQFNCHLRKLDRAFINTVVRPRQV